MSREDPLKSPLRSLRGEQVVKIEGESVVLAYDPDGEVWFVRTASLPGIVASAPELDDLLDELPPLILQAKLP